ncbi:MAG: S41 family peptidase [Janthinobacterium lividum]
MPKSLKLSLLAVSAVLLLTMFLGANTHRVRAAGEQQDGAYRQMQVYSEVLRHIQGDYVVDPNMGKVTDAAMRGLLENLDSDSSYLTPEEYNVYKTHSGGKAQVGLTIAKRFGYATIVSVVQGSPADRANLNDGDVIEQIADRKTNEISLLSAKLLLDGQPGSTISLSVIHPRHPAPEKVTLTRVDVPVAPAGEVFYEGASILYIKPIVIDHDHVQQVENKLKNMGKTNTKKILLDLRDVSSGDNVEALRLANLFIKTGTLATLEGQKVSKQTFTADPGKNVNAAGPMVTLVNHGTAGPAELVAGALLDSKRSELVGEKTFGDGSQQRTFEMPDGAALVLTVAKYSTPSGKKYQDEGLTPPVAVASMQDASVPSDDDDDDAADGAESTQTVNSAKPAVPIAKPAVKVDDQLNKALDLLKAKAA